MANTVEAMWQDMGIPPPKAVLRCDGLIVSVAARPLVIFLEVLGLGEGGRYDA